MGVLPNSITILTLHYAAQLDTTRSSLAAAWCISIQRAPDINRQEKYY